MTADYFVLRLSSVGHRAEKWLSQRAFKFGALGISEALGFRQPEGEEDVFIAIADERSLEIYFAAPPDPQFLAECSAMFPEIRVEVSGEATRDWLAEWKKGFEPFALTERYWVVPSWCKSPVPDEFAIRIDPGMAFGTGTHETTRLVAREMERMGPSLGCVLDVGTGTGLLAILAARMGASRVVATEVEADGRRVAGENFALNQVKVELGERQVEAIDSVFDVVVANIIDGVLVRIQEALKAKVKPGGWLVVSGVITERERDFIDGFKLPAGRAWDVRRRDGDWLLFAVRL